MCEEIPDLSSFQVLYLSYQQVIERRDEMEVRKPLLVKIAPDLTDRDKEDIAAIVTSRKVNKLEILQSV